MSERAEQSETQPDHLAEVAAGEARYIMATYKRQPLEVVRGEGWRLFDADGREYLDFVAGIAVNVLGHSHPKVVEAIARQAAQAIHVSDLYYSRPQVELVRRLNQLGFEGRAFLTNSGTEAVEAAIKVARKWGKLHRGGAYEVISAVGSFHGRTLGALAATGQPKYQEPFAPMPDGFRQVPYNDIEALRRACSDQTVAVLLEPVQGEGGVVPATPEYLGGVRQLCDQRNLLLILDEVQTGVGRTGHFYAFQGYGVVPDIVTLAKGLGGGVPIGVCLAGRRADVLGPGEHGSTFGGNPLAAAAAVATLEAIEAEGVVENARQVGVYLAEQLGGLKLDFHCITEVRGAGLLQAIALDRDLASRLQAEALAQGLLLNAIGERVIRLIPPLTIGRPEVDRAVMIMAQCLDIALGDAPTPPPPAESKSL